MPEVDMTGVPDAEEGNFDPIPSGDYRAQVDKVESKNDKNGNEYFNVKFKVIGGEFAGKVIWDNVFFTEKSLPRLKLIASRLLDIKPLGKINITEDMFTNQTCIITVIQEDYVDKEGNSKRKNAIPFSGYANDTEDGDTQENSDDDLPF